MNDFTAQLLLKDGKSMAELRKCPAYGAPRSQRRVSIEDFERDMRSILEKYTVQREREAMSKLASDARESTEEGMSDAIEKGRDERAGERHA